MLTAKKAKVSKLPTTTGVYIFKHGAKTLYVGKANNIKNRVSSYFSKSVPAKIKELIKEATKLSFHKTDSEPEALILEAKLIKSFQPKYNVLFRDDKNYFFVGFTKEKYPRVFLTHQLKLKKFHDKASFIGPFTEGSALKIILRNLRKTLAFCTCKSKHDKLCFNYHLKLCFGVCCLKPRVLAGRYKYLNNSSSRKRYLESIFYLKSVLSGNKKSLMRDLKKQMLKAAKEEDFERAIEIRKITRSLDNILEHKHVNFKNEFIERAVTLEQAKKTLGLSKEPERIEAYDISNISGTLAVGTMVVFKDADTDKNQYRKFKIRTINGQNDVAMMKEMLERRLSHQEWQLPDLLFVDGGMAQLNAARAVLSNRKISVPIIAFAKGLKNVFLSHKAKPIPLNDLPERVQNFIVKIKDEVHRFSITYHKSLRSKALLKNGTKRS
ncbi:hypothetical protein C4553_03480 [Candidatus Parcubacteria bacterium]|nr:MAG: hypothetical protein C4553_03480 [Candidatus Parcubacteria bacterium]